MRSKVELATVLQGQLDLAKFDYKSGKFYDREAAPIRVRNRVKVLPLFTQSSRAQHTHTSPISPQYFILNIMFVQMDNDVNDFNS